MTTQRKILFSSKVKHLTQRLLGSVATDTDKDKPQSQWLLRLVTASKTKYPTQRLIGAIATGFVVVGSTTYLVVNKMTSMSESELTKLTLPVQAQDIALRISASGQVEATQLVNISPKISGELVDLRVEQGDWVKKGQIIARMDDRNLQSKSIQANAKGQQIQTQLNLSQTRVKRYQYLAQQGAISQDELDQRISEYKSNRAKLQEVQGEIKAGQVELEDTIIRAPFDGVITQKYVTEGAFIAPTPSASGTESTSSSAIVAIASGVEIVAKVPETDLAQIQRGQAVEIVADAYPNQKFKGRVRSIAPAAVKEQNVTFFQVRVSLETGKEDLLSGMNLDLTFLGKPIHNALVIPTVVIVTEQGKTGVLVPSANNKPQFRPVTIGASIKDRTQILEGINEGDRIFINPPENYQPAL